MFPASSAGIYSLMISPDSQHLLYVAGKTRDQRAFVQVYVDGTPGAEYDALLPFPYDRRPRFFFDAPDRIHYFAVKDRMIYRVEVSLPPTAVQR